MLDLESEESAAKRRKLYAEQPTQLKQINLISNNRYDLKNAEMQNNLC